MDHSLVPVMVAAGQAVTGIAVTDFYAPPNAFPLVPTGGPSAPPLPSPSSDFSDAPTAAIYEAQVGTGSVYVTGSFDRCPINHACVTLGDEHDGRGAAYFVAEAGSNSDVISCGVYVFHDASGWHPLNTACGAYPAPGQTVSATFMGSGCINVRANPGYTARIVDCLPVDTTVTIDAGPVFVQEAVPSDAGNLNRVWWHLVGRGWPGGASGGWMVHQYLSH